MDAAVAIVVAIVVTVASVIVANEARDVADVVAAVAGADISAMGPLLLLTSMTRQPSLHYLKGPVAWVGVVVTV